MKTEQSTLPQNLYLGAFQLLEVVAILRSSGAGLADRCPAEKGISGRGSSFLIFGRIADSGTIQAMISSGIERTGGLEGSSWAGSIHGLS